MAYKENIGSCIAEFDQGVKKSGLPFDTERKLLLLIAQADIEEAILVSKDQIFTEYEVKVVW